MNKKYWLDRPVFVTGATGFLGGWLVESLYEAGADVVCLVRDWSPHSRLVRSGMIEKFKTVRGDVCDQSLLERILNEYEINTVFHLAAQTIVSIAGRNPVSTFESNIKGTWSLLEACRRGPSVQGVVMASSDKAYGDCAALPYGEETPLRGNFPYDVSKSCADLIAQSYAANYKLPVVITRCGNFYGGGDLNWNRIVPGTIRSVIRNQTPVIRSDGKFIRDYFYIEDGAAAYLMLAEKLAADKAIAGSAYNFSNEKPLSVIELVKHILKAMDSTVEPEILNKPVNEIREQYLNATKARNELGWQPQYGIEEGLKRTVSWYKEYFK